MISTIRKCVPKHNFGKCPTQLPLLGSLPLVSGDFGPQNVWREEYLVHGHNTTLPLSPNHHPQPNCLSIINQEDTTRSSDLLMAYTLLVNLLNPTATHPQLGTATLYTHTQPPSIPPRSCRIWNSGSIWEGGRTDRSRTTSFSPAHHSHLPACRGAI